MSYPKDKILMALEKLSEDRPGLYQRTKDLLPLAGVGGAIGVGKGFAEKSIERGLGRALGVGGEAIAKAPKQTILKALKTNIPWAAARGLTGAGSTLLIGLTLTGLMDRLKDKAKRANQAANIGTG